MSRAGRERARLPRPRPAPARWLATLRRGAAVAVRDPAAARLYLQGEVVALRYGAAPASSPTTLDGRPVVGVAVRCAGRVLVFNALGACGAAELAPATVLQRWRGTWP